MKKAIIVLIMLMLAAPSFAATIGSSGTSIGGATFKPSTLVILDLERNASAYSVGSKHKNGSKCYASTNDDSTISSYDGTVGTDITNSMVTAADTLATECN